MHNGVKLLTGLAATVVLARAAMMVEGYTILGRMGWWAQQALAMEGVTDGSISLRADNGHAARIVRLSGTADAATRSAVITRLKCHPMVADARWEER
jgi:hypothetical protein